jgi:hypothetical protein
VRRFKHNNLLVRERFLIVLFGYRDEDAFSEYAEWIDLRKISCKGEMREEIP